MDKFYFYKMTCDNGGAPCIDNGILSLAICKPVIRRAANECDVILGFGGKKLGEKLIYFAKISKIVVNGEYYHENEMYSNRKDCIYRWEDDELIFRDGSKFHDQSHRDHDVVIAKHHKYRANVILANEFVYFGKDGTDEYKNIYSALKESIEGMRQGHRINHSQVLIDELRGLYNNYIWKYGTQKIIGHPHHKPDNLSSCSETEGKVRCVQCSPRKTE